MESIRIQADAIVVSPLSIHRPGQIVVSRGRILECTDRCTTIADIELPGAMLSPALINAHTHLEFSDLEHPFAADKSFPQWIRTVVEHRRQKMAELPSEGAFNDWRANCIQAGMRESRQFGVAILADIVTRPWSPSYLESHSLPLNETLAGNCVMRAGIDHSLVAKHLSLVPQVLALAEVLGLDAQRFDDALSWGTKMVRQLDAEHSTTSLLGQGLSPHSTYSLLFDRLQNQLATQSAVEPLTAMHVAESLEEREWLEHGSGPFRTAFEQLGVSLDAPRPTIEEVIKWLASRRRALLVHGNYLSLGEIEKIARAESMSVVYCPRTHLHFGHAEYPLKHLIGASVNVVLGTDSRASNPDLSVWSEVNTLRHRHAWVSPQWAFAAVTEAAARALGVDHLYGTLDVGKRAAMNVSSISPNTATADLLDELTVRVNPLRPLMQH